MSISEPNNVMSSILQLRNWGLVVKKNAWGKCGAWVPTMKSGSRARRKVNQWLLCHLGQFNNQLQLGREEKLQRANGRDQRLEKDVRRSFQFQGISLHSHPGRNACSNVQAFIHLVTPPPLLRCRAVVVGMFCAHWQIKLPWFSMSTRFSRFFPLLAT